MTLNLPNRIGTNFGAASDAARQRAFAGAAIRRAGISSGIENSGRGDDQAPIRADRAASSVRALGETGSTRDDRARPAGYVLRKGPDSRFVTQMLAQSDLHGMPGATRHASAVASYPSLESDIDIFLPGEDIVFAETASRVDVFA